MQLVEQDVINSMDQRYAAIDRTAFASKNLYSAALHQIRQAFIYSSLASALSLVINAIEVWNTPIL